MCPSLISMQYDRNAFHQQVNISVTKQIILCSEAIFPYMLNDKAEQLLRWHLSMTFKLQNQ